MNILDALKRLEKDQKNLGTKLALDELIKILIEYFRPHDKKQKI